MLACSKENRPASMKKLIAILDIEFGIARRTALEYINTLIDSGLVELKGDELWIPEKPTAG